MDTLTANKQKSLKMSVKGLNKERGMKRVKKPKNSTKYTLSDRQLNKVKEEVTRQAIDRAMLIILGAVQEQFHMTEAELEEFGRKIQRYADYVEKDVLKLKEIQDIVNRNSEFKITGF